jgi:polyphosphate kinase 2 (PPK2 family)
MAGAMQSMISDDLQEGLAQAQQALYVKKVPVLIIFEGASGRVISRVINELIRCLEPRGVHYCHFDPRFSVGARAMAGYLHATPAAGDI